MTLQFKPARWEHALPPMPWLRLVRSFAGKRIMPVCRRYPQDATQEIICVALEVAQAHGPSPKEDNIEAIRFIDASFRLAYHSYMGHRHDEYRADGVHGDRYGDRLEREEGERYPRCGLLTCEQRGTYRDDRHGRLCRRHKMIVKSREKRGWDGDPYHGLEWAGYEIPKRNREFWELIRGWVSFVEWVELWDWAHGRKPRPAAAIERLNKNLKTLQPAREGVDQC